jgi:hypothetical protein
MEDNQETTAGRCDTTERDRRNQRRVVVWGLLWMGSWLAVQIAVRLEWLAIGFPATAAAVVSSLLSLGLFRAEWRFVVEADELRRKVELDALALAFGVGLVAGHVYWLVEQTTGWESATDLLEVLMLMLVTYSLGVIVGLRRYR